MEAEMLLGLFQIFLINIVLSGDNAVVIALACRNLPERLRKKAVVWGSLGAVGLRIALTFVAVWLLDIPYVQVAGGLLLLFIAVKLLMGEGEESHSKSGSSIGAAIRTIIVADLVMSLDNVIAVAGAAGGNIMLIILGLILSIPLITFGSRLLMALMDRFPIIIWLGAGLLGYTSGEMAVRDKAVGHYVEAVIPASHYVIPIAFTILVIVSGLLLAKKKKPVKISSDKIQSAVL